MSRARSSGRCPTLSTGGDWVMVGDMSGETIGDPTTGESPIPALLFASWNSSMSLRTCVKEKWGSGNGLAKDWCGEVMGREG